VGVDGAEKFGIMLERERKRVFKMYGIPKSTSVNGFLASLPRVKEKKIWKVTDTDGTVVQYVSATDNRKITAQKYINEKYPDRDLTLTFSHCKGFVALPR
jgi:hypothetical protein